MLELRAMKMPEPAEICVLITGASSGIGAGLAREFSRRGMRVALVARRIAQLEVLGTELRATGVPASAHCGDVTVDGDIARVVGELAALGVAPHIVIANAGFGVVGNAANLDLADYRRQFETNVFGVVRTLHESLPALRNTQGRFVIMGSVAGHLSSAGSSPYTMSKFAVRALAEALHGELRSAGQIDLVYANFELEPAAMNFKLCKAVRQHAVDRRARKCREQIAAVRRTGRTRTRTRCSIWRTGW